MKKTSLLGLAVLVLCAAAVYAATFHAGITVSNDYLWYNASDIVTVTVDGQPYQPTPVGSYDGAVDLTNLPSGTHTVSVSFQAGQQYNYVITNDTCSGTFSGSAFSCGVDVAECPDGPGAC